MDMNGREFTEILQPPHRWVFSRVCTCGQRGCEIMLQFAVKYSCHNYLHDMQQGVLRLVRLWTSREVACTQTMGD